MGWSWRRTAGSPVPAAPRKLAYGHGAACVLVGRGPGLIAERLAHVSLAGDFVDQYRETGDAFRLRARGALGPGRGLPGSSCRTQSGWRSSALQSRRRASRISSLPPRRASRSRSLGPRACRRRASSRTGSTLAATRACRIRCCCLRECLERASPGDLIVLDRLRPGCRRAYCCARPRASDRRGAAQRKRPSRTVSSIRDYLRFLSHCGVVEMDWGKRAERDARTAQTVAWRKHRDVTAFVGGRCRRCDTVQYPRTRACVNPECRAFDTQDEQPLADTGGTVKTYTEDWLAVYARPAARVRQRGLRRRREHLHRVHRYPSGRARGRHARSLRVPHQGRGCGARLPPLFLEGHGREE